MKWIQNIFKPIFLQVMRAWGAESQRQHSLRNAAPIQNSGRAKQEKRIQNLFNTILFTWVKKTDLRDQTKNKRNTFSGMFSHQATKSQSSNPKNTIFTTELTEGNGGFNTKNRNDVSLRNSGIQEIKNRGNSDFDRNQSDEKNDSRKHVYEDRFSHHFGLVLKPIFAAFNAFPPFTSANSAVKTALIPLICLFIHVNYAFSAPPTWWTTQQVLDTTKPSNDYAAVNQGQLKAVAKKAITEMNAQLAGGAGTELNALLTSWTTPDASRNDFQAVNVGQVKALAKKFYDRLNAVGVTTPYPWSAATTDDIDYAMANIGQVKNAFNFTIPSGGTAGDSDSDGLSDAWEQQFFGNLTQTGSGNPDNDGLTNLQELNLGTNPTVADTDADGINDGAEITAGTNPLSEFPIRERFESYPLNTSITTQAKWSASGTGSAVVQSVEKQEGAQGLKITNTNSFRLERSFNTNDQEVWVEFQIKPKNFALNEVPTLAATSVIGFYFDSTNKLRAYNGTMSTWQTVTTTASDLTQWQKITVQQKYGSKKWSLWLNGTQVVNEFGFANTTISKLSKISILPGNRGDVFLDDLKASTTIAVTPAAPTNLTATAGNAQVTLNWTAVSGATSYKVQSSTMNGSGYADFAGNTVTEPTVTLTNTGLTNGTTYYYVVFALNGVVQSTPSNQASATPAGATLPGDSDGNGLADAWEIQYFGATGVNPAGDPDGDGVTSLDEFMNGTDPTDSRSVRLIFVDGVNGSDLNSGKSSEIGLNGPKKTIQGGLISSDDYDTIQIQSGSYSIDALIFSGTTVRIKPKRSVDVTPP